MMKDMVKSKRIGQSASKFPNKFWKKVHRLSRKGVHLNFKIFWNSFGNGENFCYLCILLKIKNMQEKIKKYVFYTLSSESNLQDVRYVGVTSCTLKSRLSQHKYTGKNPLKRVTPVAKWIYSLMLKNENVIITQIDECDVTEWENLEIDLIQKYKELGYKLLNIDKGGRGSITKEKRVISGIQRSISAHEIKIVQLDLLGNYIKTYDSIVKASNEHNFSSSGAINNVLKKRSNTAGGYFWLYESDFLNKNYELIPTKTTKESKGFKHYQYNKDTFKLIKVFLSKRDVISEFLNSGDSNAGSLDTAIKNKTMWKNSFWSLSPILDFTDYFDNTFKIFEIDSIGSILNKFKTNVEAALYFNLKDCTISNQIRNNTKTKNNTYLIKNTKIKI